MEIQLFSELLGGFIEEIINFYTTVHIVTR